MKKKGLTGVLATVTEYAVAVGQTVGAIAGTIGQTVGIIEAGSRQPASAPINASPGSSGSPPPNPTPQASAVAKAEESAFGWKLAVGAIGILLVVVIFAAGLFRRK